MEIVIFYKLVEVDTQHLKANTNMGSEGKVGINPHDVLAVLMVLVSEGLQYFDLDLSLLMQFLPVLENLDGDMFLGLVIKAPKHDTEGTPSQLFLNFIPKENLVLGLIQVIRLIIVEPMIIRWSLIIFRILVLARLFIFNVLAHPFVLGIQVEVVNHIVVADFVPFVLAQVLTIVLEHIVRAHWELGWA